MRYEFQITKSALASPKAMHSSDRGFAYWWRWPHARVKYGGSSKAGRQQMCLSQKVSGCESSVEFHLWAAQTASTLSSPTFSPTGPLVSCFCLSASSFSTRKVPTGTIGLPPLGVPTRSCLLPAQASTAPSGRQAEPNGVSLLISLGFNLKKKRTAGDQVILPGLCRQPLPPAAVLINGCASCRASVIGVSKVFTQSFTPNCHEGQNNRASPMQVKYLSGTSSFQAAY